MMKLRTIDEIIDASGMAPEKVNEIIDNFSKRTAVEGRYKKHLPGIPTLFNLHIFYPEKKDDDLEAAKLYQQFFLSGSVFIYIMGHPERERPRCVLFPMNRPFIRIPKNLRRKKLTRLPGI
jgi:hypothetical protein